MLSLVPFRSMAGEEGARGHSDTVAGQHANHEAGAADAGHAQMPEAGDAHHGEKAFNAGKMIIHHVLDAHEWHMADIGKVHITIPLPIILWDKDEKQLVSFWSSKLEHGHAAYKGFMLATEGEHEGRIVKVLPGTMQADPGASLPIDLSITKTVLAIFISMLILSLIFISIARRYSRDANRAPRGLQSWMEPLILFVRDEIARPSIGDKRYERYMPFLLSVFFFILLNNFMGLIPIFPGGANVTGNIAVTLVLALFTFIITTFSGNKHYWMHIFNTPGVPWWLKLPFPLLPIVEFLGIFIKPFVLMVRLFANITAGHVIILGFMSLIFIFGNMNTWLGYGVSAVSVPFAIFMNLLELLVAFIQAYVFTLLSALYFGMAIEEHH